MRVLSLERRISLGLTTWGALHGLLLSRHEEKMGFEDLLLEVVLVCDEFVELNNVLIQKHTCNLSGLRAKRSFNLLVNRVSDQVLLISRVGHALQQAFFNVWWRN